MTNSSQCPPFYRQMIDLLRNAFALLDEQGRVEVLQFILSQQNPDGGFQDRGRKSDLYYSLFGGLILKAIEKEQVKSQKYQDTSIKAKYSETNTRNPKPETRNSSAIQDSQPATRNSQLVTESILKLSQFITRHSTLEVPGFIERCCLVLLQKELKTGRSSQIKALLSLGKSFWKEHHSINLSYRSFVLFLTLDAIFPCLAGRRAFQGIIKRAAKSMLARTMPDANSPCSEVAATVFLHKLMDQNGSEGQELLKSFAFESGGFKAFSHLQQADMLSTAVALYALNYAGCDLRLLKSACLDFIQSNFSDGAFLSGDGDQTRDMEYTFYGLLAVGVLVN